MFGSLQTLERCVCSFLLCSSKRNSYEAVEAVGIDDVVVPSTPPATELPPPDPAAVGLNVTAEVDAALLLPPLLGLGVVTELAAALPPLLGLDVVTELDIVLPAVLGLGVATELVDVLPAVLPPADGLGVITPASPPVPPAEGLDVVAPAPDTDGLCVPPEPANDDDGLDAVPVLVSDGLGVETSSVANTGEIVGH